MSQNLARQFNSNVHKRWQNQKDKRKMKKKKTYIGVSIALERTDTH
jgi:hypothetical protein